MTFCDWYSVACECFKTRTQKNRLKDTPNEFVRRWRTSGLVHDTIRFDMEHALPRRDCEDEGKNTSSSFSVQNEQTNGFDLDYIRRQASRTLGMAVGQRGGGSGELCDS